MENDSDDSKKEVERLSAAWNKAWLEKDKGVVEELMAKEYVYVAPDGQVLDRAKILSIIQSPGYKLYGGKWTEVTVTLIDSDFAILINRWQGGGEYDGRPFKDDHRCTKVWARRDGA